MILLGILGYGWLTDFQTLSVWFVALALGLALLAEVFEAWIGFRFAQRYGGSSRAGWGALVGGFVGAFVGAALFEYTRARRSEGAVRAGWGAVLGRAAAAAVKMAVGIVMVVGALFVAPAGVSLRPDPAPYGAHLIPGRDGRMVRVSPTSSRGSHAGDCQIVQAVLRRPG